MGRRLSGRHRGDLGISLPHEVVQAMAAVGGPAAGVSNLLGLGVGVLVPGHAVRMIAALNCLHRVRNQLLIVAEVRGRPAHLQGQHKSDQQ